MGEFIYQGKGYQLDQYGFLKDFSQWDRNFAEGMAEQLMIDGGLTEDHWKVIHSIRDSYKESGKCPLVYQTCRENDLRLWKLKKLFPTGYLRGACKLAGITYKLSGSMRGVMPAPEDVIFAHEAEPEKTYVIDAFGFLTDPASWDKNFTVLKAEEMKMPEGLTEKHWSIINYLREYHAKNHRVPTVIETCESNNMELDDLEKLFPDGYHRGAVKLAGLRQI